MNSNLNQTGAQSLLFDHNPKRNGKIYIYILIEIDGNGICLAELTTFSLKDHHSLTGPDSYRTGFPPNEPHLSDGPHDPFPRRCFEPVQFPATFPRRSPTFFFYYCMCMLQKTTSFY